MATAIEQWPPEVMESVTTYLPLTDLSNLRLASKALAILVAQDTFKQYYRTKHLDVSPSSLVTFAQMTGPGLLGAEVENLVITGLAVDVSHLERVVEEKARWETESNGPLFCSTQKKLSPEEVEKVQGDLDALRKWKRELEEFRQSGEDARLLAEAFSNIAAYGKHGKLQSLTLEVALLQEDVGTRQKPIQAKSRDAVWQAGEAAFRAVVGGLAGSGMPLEKFDVFTGQWHCSLGWNVLACIQELGRPGLQQSLGALRSVSLSLSAGSKAGKEAPGGTKIETEVGDEAKHRVLASFFSLCHGLTHLHIHWFRLRSAKYDDTTAEKLLQQATESHALPKLSSLTLRGVWFDGLSLLGLLRSAPIRNLHLENINIADPNPATADESSDADGDADSRPALTSPQWSQIFSYCTSAEAHLSSVFFDDLWGRRLVHFKNAPGGPRMPWTPWTNYCPTLEREEEKVREEIEYTYARGRPLGSPQAYNWRVVREREYGPA